MKKVVSLFFILFLCLGVLPVGAQENTKTLVLWKNDRSGFVLDCDEEATLSIKGFSTVQVTVHALDTVPVQTAIGESDQAVYEVADVITDATSGTHGFWLTVETDEDSVNETGTLILRKESGTEEIPLNIRVNDLCLTQMLSLDLWQYPYVSANYWDLTPFSSEHKALLKQELEYYQSLGGKDLSVMVVDEPWGHQTYADTPSMVKWDRKEDGTFTFDWSELDEWLKLADEVGLSGNLNTFSILPWGNAITLTHEDGSEDRLFLTVGSYSWTLIWNTFLDAYYEHLESLGKAERAVLCIDERSEEEMAAILSLDGIDRFSMHASINCIPEDLTVYDRFEEVSVSLATLQEDTQAVKDFIAYRKGQGLTTVLYACSGAYPNSFAYSDPSESTYIGLLCASYGFDGFLRWAYDSWNADPYTSMQDANFEPGDSFLVYPARNDTAIYGSVRLEQLVLGLKNSEKLLQMRAYMEDADREAYATYYENLALYQTDVTDTWAAIGYRTEEIRSETKRLQDLITGLGNAITWMNHERKYRVLWNARLFPKED